MGTNSQLSGVPVGAHLAQSLRSGHQVVGVAVCKAKREGNTGLGSSSQLISEQLPGLPGEAPPGLGGEGGAGPGRSVWQLDSMFKILAAFLLPVLLGHLHRPGRREGSQLEPYSSER